jgi:predicted aconitase with swiveling domain
MTDIVLRGRRLVSGIVEGEALVSHEPMGFLARVDRVTGIFSQNKHELDGARVTDKILICPTITGSTGDSFWIYEMAMSKTAPKGIINLKGDAVVVMGAIIGHIPMLDQVEPDPTQVIHTGDYIELDADQGMITVVKKAA